MYELETPESVKLSILETKTAVQSRLPKRMFKNRKLNPLFT